MVSKLVLGAGLALAMVAASATGAFAVEDKKFVNMAIRANMAEIAIGGLAASKGSTDAVRSFGADMKADHTAANDKAMPLAKALNVREPKRLPKQFQTELDKLQGLSGAEFDAEFLTYNVKVHRRQVRLFTEQAKSSNAEVAAFATATLPTLQEHLKTAQSMAPKGQRKARAGGARKAPAAAAPAASGTSSDDGSAADGTGDGSDDGM